MSSTSSPIDEFCWQHNRLAVVNIVSPEFASKFQRKVPLFLEVPKFHYNTVWDRWMEVPCQNQLWLGIAILGSRIWRSQPHFQSQNLGTECWSSKSQDFGIEKQDLGLLNWLHKDITNNYNFTLILVFFACNIIYTWHTLQIYVWPTGIFFTLSHYRSSKKSSCSRPMDTTLNT